MNIVTFEQKHIKEAKAIALANYYEEKKTVTELPDVSLA